MARGQRLDKLKQTKQNKMKELGKLSADERKAIQPMLDKVAEIRIEAKRNARREYCPFCGQYRARKKKVAK